jgi:hypothetical protein
MSKETPQHTRVRSAVIMRQLEAAAGTRFCKHCDAMLPLDRFTRKDAGYLCDTHRRLAQRKSEFGTVERRALSTLCAKAQGDRRVFGHARMALRKSEMAKMLTQEHIQNYPEWAIVPRDPTRETAADNAALITVYQRRCLVRNWKKHRAPDMYMDLLRRALEQPALCAG